MRSIPVFLSMLIICGCSDSPKAVVSKSKLETNLAASTSDTSLLQAALMPQKPSSAISVTEAMQKKAGEVVIVTGKLPPENVKPFNTALAAFIMLAPESLAREEVKEELACDDAATCPSCRKLLDSLGVRVEVVDKSGAIIPASMEGFKDMKPGSVITVEGEIKRDGKNNKLVRIVAKRFYPG